MNRADVEVDQLQAAEGALDSGEALVGQYDLLGSEPRRVDGRPYDVDAIERSLLGDALLVTLKAETALGDLKPEMLAHLLAAPDHAHAQAGFGPSAQAL